jgi:hypothetical protein
MKTIYKLMLSLAFVGLIASCNGNDSTSTSVGLTGQEIAETAATKFENDVYNVSYHYDVMNVTVNSLDTSTSTETNIEIYEQKDKDPYVANVKNINEENETSSGSFALVVRAIDVVAYSVASEFYNADGKSYQNMSNSLLALLKTLQVVRLDCTDNKIYFDEEEVFGGELDIGSSGIDAISYIKFLSDPTLKDTGEHYIVTYELTKDDLIALSVDIELDQDGLSRETASEEQIAELTTKYTNQYSDTEVEIMEYVFKIDYDFNFETVETSTILNETSDSYETTTETNIDATFDAYNDDVEVTIPSDLNEYVDYNDVKYGL